MSFFKKKWGVLLIAAALVAAASFVTEHFAGFNPVSVAVNTVVTPVKSGFSYVAAQISGFRDFIWDMRAYREENERLASENMTLRRENRDTQSYREENERLTELLELKNNTTDYSTVAARIISRSDDVNGFVVEINKGLMNGINKDNAVLSPDGVVGKVTEVGPNYAIVTTILDPSSAIGIRVSRTGGSGLAVGDEELAEKSQCRLSFMDKNTPIIVGDAIESSGSGGVYPEGLSIGTVSSIEADSTGTLSNAIIEPAVDFDSLNEVLVINGTV